MRPLSFGLSAAALLAGQMAAGQTSSSPSHQGELVYTLSIMRHGVRSPTGKADLYSRYSSAPWPAWSVAPGYLTPHGYELIRLLGTYDRQSLAARGLFSKDGCADVSRVTIHADSDERTQQTAKALAEGMFPGCKVPVQARDEGANDPLFHLEAGSVPVTQAKRGAAAVLGRIGNDPASVAAAYRAELAELDRILASCGVASPKADRTSLLSIPATVAAGSGDHIAEMKGPLNTASTLTENLLLEYTDGRPANEVGWGCVDGTKLRELIDLHTAASDIALRTPAVAGPQAAALLKVAAASIEQAATEHAVPGAEGRVGDKALVLVGHDTNLTNISGALGADWLIDGRRDDTPPGSRLVFELWRRPDGGFEVRTFFTTQTLEQMRDATPPSADSPPPRVPVFLPGCSGVDDACSLAGLAEELRRAVKGR